jgi:hypothetical protein
VGVEDRIRAVRLGPFGVGDRFGEPGVVVLAVELENPARHRHWHPDAGAEGGELTHERIEPFPGRLACDRYAAARRNTSFSCSNNRLRRLRSRNSDSWPNVGPGFTPSSTSAARSH